MRYAALFLVVLIMTALPAHAKTTLVKSHFTKKGSYVHSHFSRTGGVTRTKGYKSRAPSRRHAKKRP